MLRSPGSQGPWTHQSHSGMQEWRMAAGTVAGCSRPSAFVRVLPAWHAHYYALECTEQVWPSNKHHALCWRAPTGCSAFVASTGRFIWLEKQHACWLKFWVNCVAGCCMPEPMPWASTGTAWRPLPAGDIVRISACTTSQTHLTAHKRSTAQQLLQYIQDGVVPCTGQSKPLTKPSRLSVHGCMRGSCACTQSALRHSPCMLSRDTCSC